MRRGYTLFELVIVLALLLTLAALSIPPIESMYADYKLQAGVDQVSACWASLRARAISEGRPYRFAVNGDAFRGAPDDPAYWSGGDPPSSGDGPAPLVVQDTLPRGISFGPAGDNSAGGIPEASPDATAPGNVSPTTQGNSGQWTLLASFLPDGTADQDVGLVFQSSNAGPITLQLRALTGGMSTRRQTANSQR